jgi:chromosome segregation ATPase
MSEEEYHTPYRGAEDKEPSSTGYKKEEEERNQGESYIEGEQSGRDPHQHLEEIEADIRRVEERLRENQTARKEVDADSEDYEHLEEERRELRKALIDYDHDHKRCFLRVKKENQEKVKREHEEKEQKLQEQVKEIEAKREQEKLERSRRLEREIEEINQSSRKRREEIERRYGSPAKVEE